MMRNIDLGDDNLSYFFDTQRYVRTTNKGQVMGVGSMRKAIANLTWLTFPTLDVYLTDKDFYGVHEDLEACGYFEAMDDICDDYEDYAPTLNEFMEAGPIAFVNRMKAWSQTKDMRTYVRFGGGWLDTMAVRALAASSFLGNESNPVPRQDIKRVVVPEGNVYQVDFRKPK